jgi:hypothetical protein
MDNPEIIHRFLIDQTPSALCVDGLACADRRHAAMTAEAGPSTASATRGKQMLVKKPNDML